MVCTGIEHHPQADLQALQAEQSWHQDLAKHSLQVSSALRCLLPMVCDAAQRPAQAGCASILQERAALLKSQAVRSVHCSP